MGASIILADRPIQIGQLRLQARLVSLPFSPEPGRSPARDPSLEPPHPIAPTPSTPLTLAARSVAEPAGGGSLWPWTAAAAELAESLARQSLSGLAAVSAAAATEAGGHWRRLSQSQQEWFGRHMHPVFALSSAQGDESALRRAGCENPAEVLAAVERVLSRGSAPGGEILLEDLCLVREAITLMDKHKHERLQAVYTPERGCSASGAAPASAAIGPAPAPGTGTGPAGRLRRGAAAALWRRYAGGGGDLQLLADPPLGAGERVEALGLEGAGGSFEERMYFKTVVRERDLILARELWMQAGQPGVSKVIFSVQSPGSWNAYL